MDIQEHEIHIWVEDVGVEKSSLPDPAKILSPDEIERAGRYKFKDKSEQFKISRCLLRLVLSLYTNVKPGDLSFGYNEWGKLEIIGGMGPSPVKFNLSHSKSLAVIGVGLDLSLGVDVSYVDPEVDFIKIMDHFMTDEERDEITRFPENLQREAFFRCWTRKEALVKAMGRALLEFLTKVRVPAKRVSRPIIVRDVYLSEQTAGMGNFKIADLDVGGSYFGAVAFPERDIEIRYIGPVSEYV